LNDRTLAFLKKVYREYYFRKSDSIGFPDEIQSREFGYIPFGGGMVRHLSFKSAGDAAAEILRQSPSSVYCSNARYESPTLPMESKGWKGAELIFDIDATDIPTSCKKSHDFWYCEKCHANGKLPKPPACTKCKGQTADFHGTCSVCLAASKEHTLRVVDFLLKDFGVSRRDITAYFSGNRGYHLQVCDPRFERLDQQARAEIADYVLGGSLPPSQTLAASIRRRPAESPAEAYGWMRRIWAYTQSRSGYTGTLQKLVSEAVSVQRAMIDASVTTDIHRVFRLAGTLHGNTGMAKMRVGSFETFDPERNPVVISGEKTSVQVSFYPRFTMNGETFGPFNSEVVSLPSYAAVPILTRGFGELV
jgi:DNA primase small subunit